MIAQANTFLTEVPSHPYNIILVNPTPGSVTVSVVSNAEGPAEGYVEYVELKDGTALGTIREFTSRVPTASLAPGKPVNFVVSDLKPDMPYAYRYRFRTPDPAGQPFEAGAPGSFTTPPARSVGPAGDKPDFTFTIQADSHLDPNMTPAVYARMLENALADRPAFHIDLGDTFMVDKRREFKDALPQYRAQRYYFGLLCHSAPLFMVLGNHDGEAGYAMRGDDSIAAWSFAQRTTFFPPPLIPGDDGGDPMYSGKTTMTNGQGANYYEFTWGRAQFIVLDPFWFTTARPRGGGGKGDGKSADTAATDDNWARTLGREQYDWLTQTLKASKAEYKFVFIHHLVGGLGKANRGGMEASVSFEWGGQNADGSPGFATHRPGWELPIHDLLVKHEVTAVFHGHDHLYVHAERDGLVYQCVPQPGNVLGGVRAAEEYGYKSGTILGSPGHLRVRVGAKSATVDFIRSAIEADKQPGDEGGGRDRRADRREREANGAVVRTYDLSPAHPVANASSR